MKIMIIPNSIDLLSKYLKRTAAKKIHNGEQEHINGLKSCSDERFSWRGDFTSGPHFKQARLPGGRLGFTNVSHDLCVAEESTSYMMCTEQILERTQFLLKVDSENSRAGLVLKRA